MNDKDKALHIRKVIKYQYEKARARSPLVLDIMLINLIAQTTIFSNFVLANHTSLEDEAIVTLIRIAINLMLGAFSIRQIVAITKKISAIIGCNCGMKEVRELLASHGYILEDEISKGMGL